MALQWGETTMARQGALRRGRNTSGQGITEYGAIIAFVALLAAVTFSFTKGSLLPAVSAAFSACEATLNALSTQAASSSS
jgi:hypothetical protein